MTFILAACAGAPVLPDLPGLERQVLAAGDGWGGIDGQVTGGARATPENIRVVSNRKQLVDALKAAGSASKILRIQGTINLSTDDSGRELGYADYVDPAYDFEAYKKMVDPNVWNRQPLVGGKPPKVAGPLEEARLRSWNRQKRQVQILVPSNTTLIGIGKDARIIRGSLYLDRGVSNVIIRNIAFEDAYDHFPGWNPADSYRLDRTQPVIDDFGVNQSVSGCQPVFVDELNGPHRCNGGRWNAEFDLVSLKGATRVWIDHCSFSDGQSLAKTIPNVFAKPYHQPEQKVTPHDGLLDITNGSDYVTVSNSHFFNHDKAMLVGGSDNSPTDEGKLRVTWRHNLFEGLRQRQQLVRYGEVHSYNNLYIGDKADPQYPFAYAFGLGKSARIVSENNVFLVKGLAEPAGLVSYFVAGAGLHDTGTWLNGKPVGIAAQFNAAGPKNPIESFNWRPVPRPDLLPTEAVEAFVRAQAGPGKGVFR
ncbi:polysaccharide lyase family 1 protein [Uliginosibacterium paludis]|uniref:Polysaccharide lyase family 1 protein n=1 Tax=Uliginosibacterium paludis TaxID=1615952 RepID=A0ABV2CTB3_9RHOO